MQPLFQPAPFDDDDVAVCTFRAFAAPDGSITRYEVAARDRNGNLSFYRIRAHGSLFDSDAGYVQAEARFRQRIRELLDSVQEL